jgi:molybdopterin converting factor small subunit
MAVTFVIPGALRPFAGGRHEVRVEGTPASVAEALDLLWAECPGARDRVLTERREIRPHLNIFVDGQNIRDTGGLGTHVREASEIVILPAVSGG